MFGWSKNKELSRYLKNILGYHVTHLNIYEQAFVHRSYHPHDSKLTELNNERLEYLGDAVLSTIIADFLFKKYPHAQEGFLTNMRSKLVSRDHLNRLGSKIGLNKFVIYNGNSEHMPSSVSGNTFEAFVGAIFIDKGYNKTKKIVLNRIFDLYVDLDAIEKEDHNYKGKLLQYAQKYKQTLEYKTVKEETVAYGRKEYVVYVFLNDQFIAEGCDHNIKSAQQNAAMAACEHFGI